MRLHHETSAGWLHDVPADSLLMAEARAVACTRRCSCGIEVVPVWAEIAAARGLIVRKTRKFMAWLKNSSPALRERIETLCAIAPREAFEEIKNHSISGSMSLWNASVDTAEYALRARELRRRTAE